MDDLQKRRPDNASLGLGLLGLGLGLGALAAPRALVRALGVDAGARTPWLVRALGAREIVTTAGLFASGRTAPWLWARVGGDLIDITLVAGALRAPSARRGRAWGALGGLLGVTALDVITAVRARRAERPAPPPVKASVTIARRREDVYGFWRNPANAPSFMADVESVEVLDDRRSRWTARGPVGPVVTWESVLEEDRPGERLSWRSSDGSDVDVSGAVTFSDAPGGRGTEVRICARYAPRNDVAARAARFLWKKAGPFRLEADLRRCKQILEAGHVAHSDARADHQPHPARPSTTASFAREGQA
ncbi:MAG TPA: SRPBCC family protein [Polyangia bacterium]|nr:SRPBCC family protein [Polyangia bacterium]